MDRLVIKLEYEKCISKLRQIIAMVEKDIKDIDCL